MKELDTGNLEPLLINEEHRQELMHLVATGDLNPQQLVVLIHKIAELDLIDCSEEVEALLVHPNADVRIAALDAITFSFTSDKKRLEILRLFWTDKDEDVRAGAAAALGSIAREKQNPDILSELRTAMSDARMSAYVRDAARRAFLYGLGRSLKEARTIPISDALRL